ncbi:hypothetical protein Pvag_pPag20104 (plasmid) [Pantoea vagans C9-1]|nr:hypothetical protein Pvag_pPag20104 [Pantoea vagans C9-1]
MFYLIKIQVVSESETCDQTGKLTILIYETGDLSAWSNE